MGRTVSALVTWGDAYLVVIGPFPVRTPWWSEVEPVVAHLREVLGVPVLVLRLLLVDGGEGGRDGHVTYHVAALDRPAPGLLAERPIDQAALTGPEELRSPWARLEGIREVLNWASDTLGAAGRRVTGPAVQCKTWNLAALFRLPTGKGPVWLKTTPRDIGHHDRDAPGDQRAGQGPPDARGGTGNDCHQRHRDLRSLPVPAGGGRRQQFIVPMAARRRAPAPDRPVPDRKNRNQGRPSRRPLPRSGLASHLIHPARPAPAGR
jgi:hypothetical protein